MGGGGKSAGMSSSPAPTQEAPKPYQQEQSMSEAAQNARDAQLKKARAALGQEGTILTSPFGSQEQQSEQQQGKTLLGG